MKFDTHDQILCKIESGKCEEFPLCGLSYLVWKIKKVKTNLDFFVFCCEFSEAEQKSRCFHLNRLYLSSFPKNSL